MVMVGADTFSGGCSFIAFSFFFEMGVAQATGLINQGNFLWLV
jgi:hypothetical protein